MMLVTVITMTTRLKSIPIVIVVYIFDTQKMMLVIVITMTMRLKMLAVILNSYRCQGKCIQIL